MDSDEFKSWRKSLGLKQKEAAEKLGLKKRMIQYYETGRRGSKKVVIPKTVELACYALSVGVGAFDGSPPPGAAAVAALDPAPAEATGDRRRDCGAKKQPRRDPQRGSAPRSLPNTPLP